jgi:hypothetical protein
MINVVKITDPNKPFYSHRHTATSYLRNTRLPDGSPATIAKVLKR